MKIRILSVVNGSALSNAVNTRAQDVWFETDHPNAEYIYILPDDGTPGNTSLIGSLEVTEYPTIIFAEVINETDILTKVRIEGNASKEQIKKIYLDALNGVFHTGNGTNPDGPEFTIIKGDGDNFGVNPFGFFGLNLPPFAWLILAGISGYKTATAKKQAGQIGFGALTALAISYYFKSKNSN